MLRFFSEMTSLETLNKGEAIIDTAFAIAALFIVEARNQAAQEGVFNPTGTFGLSRTKGPRNVRIGSAASCR